MTGDTRGGARILGSLRSTNGTGAVRMQDRFDTDIDDLWSALTETERLGRWLGEVEGDLRLDGQFRARFFATGWEGTGHVQECEPPQRFLVLTSEEDEGEHAIEATLTADGDHTILVIEERGMPPDQLAAYGAGLQVHVEDLAAHIASRERRDAQARWAELLPAYQDLAPTGS
ncbi:MAG: SRPBCC domain-containing protein [Streptosporangiales bacterium]